MSSDRLNLRGDYPRPAATALVWLVAATVAAFAVQLALLSPWLQSSTAVVDLLRLTVRNLEQGRVWTLVTHGFLHGTGNPLHFLFSLIGLVLIGRELEPHLGARRFVVVYVTSLMAGATCWLATHWQTGGVHVGPTAGLLGLLVVLARIYENERITLMPFFVFSITLRPTHLVLGLVAFDAMGFLFWELRGADVPFGFAPSVHLGGMLAGWLYFRLFHAHNGWDRASSVSLPDWLRRSQAPAAGPRPPFPVERPPRPAGSVRAEMDRILDKINSEGLGSLTPEERQILDDARDLLGKP